MSVSQSKKAVLIIFAAVLALFILTSCGENADVTLPTPTASPTPTLTTTPTQAPTETPTPTSTPTPTVTIAPTPAAEDMSGAIDVPRVYITTKGVISRDDYVAATILLQDPEGKYEEILDTNASIKVRGNSTSWALKQPYNIKFESKREVLGLGEAKKWCLLANFFDKTLIRNKLAYDFAGDIGLAYSIKSTFVDVYINGRYKGNYQLSQAVGAGDTRVDIDPTKNEFIFEKIPNAAYTDGWYVYTPYCQIMFGLNDPEEPNASQKEFINKFFKSLEDALRKRDYDEVVKYIDVDSFVDFYIVNELIKSVDFGFGSTRFYLKEGKLYGGPLWDMDLAAGNAGESYHTYHNRFTVNDSTKGFYCRQLWYAQLLDCGDFEERVKARYIELQPYIVNLTTDNELGKNKIDTLVETYRKSFDKNYKVWNVGEYYNELHMAPFDTYEENVEFLRSWLISRNNWLLFKWSK